ncbi:hypothetical protein GCM10017567_35420 [Amycolatopsis bullii]|uniref:Uncharacterized protein n=1 Tax=Amycolatopsis bullii TaxID=941987 RepID=A0ABQ3KCI6_9PSEU|nr:hypothetical protein GCM10017567_35420 [Amycolatopsis bullii]
MGLTTLWWRALDEFGLALTQYSGLEQVSPYVLNPRLVGNKRGRHGHCGMPAVTVPGGRAAY